MRTLAAGLLAVAALAGCAGSGEDGREVQIRLVAPDNNIRLEGAECAGARPFEHVHPGAAYALEDAEGEVLAEGELPTGEAENADPSIDWGVERIPTVCVMALTLEDVPERDAYVLRLDEGSPIPFEASLLSPDEPLELLVP